VSIVGAEGFRHEGARTLLGGGGHGNGFFCRMLRDERLLRGRGRGFLVSVVFVAHVL